MSSLTVAWSQQLTVTPVAPSNAPPLSDYFTASSTTSNQLVNETVNVTSTPAALPGMSAITAGAAAATYVEIRNVGANVMTLDLRNGTPTSNTMTIPAGGCVVMYDVGVGAGQSGTASSIDQWRLSSASGTTALVRVSYV